MARRRQTTTPALKKVLPKKTAPPKSNRAVVQNAGPTYEVLVTAIPNGIQDSWLKVSLVLSPRLKVRNNTTLATFKPLFTNDWPNFVQGLPFQLFVDSPSGPLQLPTKGEWEFAAPPNNVPPFSSQAWAGIFHESMEVFGHRFDYKTLSDGNQFTVHTFPEKALYTEIKNTIYKSTAKEPYDQLPSRDTILQRLQKSSVVEKDGRASTGFRMGASNPVRELNRIRGLFKMPSSGRGHKALDPEEYRGPYLGGEWPRPK